MEQHFLAVRFAKKKHSYSCTIKIKETNSYQDSSLITFVLPITSHKTKLLSSPGDLIVFRQKCSETGNSHPSS